MAKNIKTEYNDLGLGTKTSSGSYRTLNKDGSFNVRKSNVPFLERINFFHSLITMSWLNFFALIIAGYLIANLIFASIYLIIGVEHLTGINAKSVSDKFIEAFFFSAQTITTLGYGRVAPVGIIANSLAAIESLLGLLAFALATGLLYGRFSKPSGRIKYSSQAVLAPYQNINAFMFRVVNPQSSQLLEVEVNVSLTMNRENSELRDFYSLELERNKIMFFPYMWTIVHPINDASPLFNLKEAELLARDAEFIVMMKAFDESFSQTVYSRSSYKASEIKWGEKFVYLVRRENEEISVDVGRIDDTEKVQLNEIK
jgi:inward rectifier potassium channel